MIVGASDTDRGLRHEPISAVAPEVDETCVDDVEDDRIGPVVLLERHLAGDGGMHQIRPVNGTIAAVSAFLSGNTRNVTAVQVDRASDH